jgi:hypothetical protein
MPSRSVFPARPDRSGPLMTRQMPSSTACPGHLCPVDMGGGPSLRCQKRDCGPVAAFVFLFVSRGATGSGRSGQCKNSWLSSSWVACRLGLVLFRRLSRRAKERARWNRRLHIESCADPAAGALFVLFARGVGSVAVTAACYRRPAGFRRGSARWHRVRKNLQT